MDANNISNIVDEIEHGVLVIGPGIYQDENGDSLKEFTERFTHTNSGLVEHYFEQYNLIKPKNPFSRLKIQNIFANFYESKFTDVTKDSFFKISQIPFPLIISLNPDDTLIKCYKEIGMDGKYADDFFKKGKKDLKNHTPKKENPYLLNLFGCYSDPESLILTFDDLFDYLKYLLPGDCIPASIKAYIRNASNITFLGVEFDKWYFQLLVKLLTEFDEKFSALRYAVPDLSSDINVYHICKENFNITFVEHDIINFINELYYHCTQHKTNKLRGIPIISEGKSFNPEIFISYKHSGESQILAEEVVTKCKKNHDNIIYDKTDLHFKGKIWDFMRRIGMGKYIIVIISDEYLKSEYCMFEFKEIMQKGKYFSDRVFPIVMPDADINRIYNWKTYVNYWKDEIKKVKVDCEEMDSHWLIRNIEVIERYEDILASIPEVMNFLNKLKYLTYQEAIDKVIIILCKMVEDKINEDLS